MSPERAYEELTRLAREQTVLESCGVLLQWDAEICMPREGVRHRGSQMALLAGLVHDRATNPRYGELLDILEGSSLTSDPESVEAVNIRELRRDYDRETRLPRRLVEEMARVHSISSQAWAEARDKDDFGSFEPWLDQVFSLAREKADAIGHAEEGERYDALLDDYEPGTTAAQLATLFDHLGGQLVPLLESLRDKTAASTPLDRKFSLDRQRAFSEGVAVDLGFDPERGRFDLGPHPFCTFIGPGDVRIALRYQESSIASGLLAVLHETGHALYEQGLDTAHYGTPMGEAVSLGVHESQSRLWENLVGRTPGFWRHYYPRLRSSFADELSGVSGEDFRRAINRVEPGPIRIEADEVTYNLHIIIRFELERALLSGNIRAADLPGAWAELYRKYLDVDPGNDRDGCLQDIHWSEGLIGYFPTYTLGNIYAAQLFAAAERDIGPLDAAFAVGEFRRLRDWLGEHVHLHGKRFPASVLIERATGSVADPSALVDSLTNRYGATA